LPDLKKVVIMKIRNTPLIFHSTL